MTENQEPGQRVSRQDIESVSRKLAVLARDLPESERAVLGLVLSRAEAAPQDVDLSAAAEPTRKPRTGPAFEQPFAGQLARAAGLFAKPEVTVVVGWQYSFAVDRNPGELIDPADLNREIGEGPA